MNMNIVIINIIIVTIIILIFYYYTLNYNSLILNCIYSYTIIINIIY